MCRWGAYIGAPTYLSALISEPRHSLIRQAQAAAECKTAINADGVGVAWYGTRAAPGLYRDVYPAWSDTNLSSLAEQVQSRLFLCHVRASTGTATSRNNCHPFVVGRWSFMHNGQIGGFDRFRRQADTLIPDTLYPHRKGATDSEALFLLALAQGLDADPLGAFARAVGQVMDLARASGVPPLVRLTAAFSDGQRLFALRYASDAHAPTLYHRWSEGPGGRMLVSEPLEAEQAGWVEVPPGTAAIFAEAGVELHPFSPQESFPARVA